MPIHHHIDPIPPLCYAVAMPRFLLPPQDWVNAELLGDEAKHLSQVLRIKSGAEITVFDGRGRRASAIVGEASRQRVTLELKESSSSTPPLPAVTLAQAIPKGKNMDLIVQKAVELGVAAIQPLITRHTIVQPGEGKADKWRRIALEACKQCGQDTLPEIAEPITFDEWIHANGFDGLSIIASLAHGAKPMREILREQSDCQKIRLLVGPEGDFSSEETANALQTGYQAVTLGEIVLRVETASLFCLSAIRYEYC